MGEPRPGFSHYDLDGNPCDWRVWAMLFQDWGRRCVAQDQVGPYRVSTVWVGIDLGFLRYPAPPLIYESMVFGDTDTLPVEQWPWDEGRLPWDQDTTRYPTREAAEQGHRELVALIRHELELADDAQPTNLPSDPRWES